MSVTLGPQFTQRSHSWTTWKSTRSVKGEQPHQYDDDGVIYTIWLYDGPEVHLCTIWKGTLPDSIVNGGYSQGQNDADKADFETNFKPWGNLSLVPTASVVPGYAATTGTNRTALRASAYTEQTTNAQRSVVSSSSTDSSAGTGARTLRLTYFDQTCLGPFTEDITLNGTTPVNTVATNICFIERIEVLTVGSNGGNAGTISLKATTAGGGATVGSIIVGDNQTNWCHHYVAVHKIASIKAIRAGVSGIYDGTISLQKGDPTNVNVAEYVVTPVMRVPSGEKSQDQFDVPILVRGPARLVLYARGEGSGTLDWTGSLSFYEA